MFGNIVLSKAGRDKDELFVVTQIEENYVFLADGDIHKIENPKRKKIKHIEETPHFNENIASKLKSNSRVTNQELKRALKLLN